MNADHVTDKVIHNLECRGHTLQPGVDLGRVGAPHLVRPTGDDAVLVNPRTSLGTHLVRGLQAVLTHQTPDPSFKTGMPRYRSLAQTLR